MEVSKAAKVPRTRGRCGYEGRPVLVGLVECVDVTLSVVPLQRSFRGGFADDAALSNGEVTQERLPLAPQY